jgi:hypothetical protein
MNNILREIKRCVIDEGVIHQFESESEFMTLTVDLMIESGQYICLAACILPSDRKAWSLKEAILGGHLVRLYKLINALLDQTCQHRRETSVVFGRMAFECVINLRFLLKNASEELFESYIHYSLKHEKKLRDTILKNIENRDGEILQIEKRMLKSIDKSFKKSEANPESLNIQQRNWGGKNLYEKARDVGLEEAYLAAIGGPSHSVHGNWQELIEYNLEETESGFVPCLDWHKPRPQLLNAVSYQSISVTIEYLEYLKYLAPQKIEEIIELLHELIGRISTFDQLHEQFVSKNQKA